MNDLTASSSILTESLVSSPSSSFLSVRCDISSSVSRRRMAFRPQSIKNTGKLYRNNTFNSNNSSNEVGAGVLCNSSAGGCSPGIAGARESLFRISSLSHSNPAAIEAFRAATAINGSGVSLSSSTSIVASQPANPKARRRLVTNWTFQETLIFYEALKQYGKDFDSIAKFMTKRKCNKDKDQVRNYYFNAFKIWKQKAHIEESDWGGVPRDARELFVVLNGCEWRKRTDDAHFDAPRYRTLILDGATSVRVKKKTVTIRTPYCPCLLKFFPYDRRNAVIPNHLSLRLTPHRFIDRNFVLACEQNPLLQIRANINDKIANVFTLLERKWSAPLNRLVSDALESSTAGDSVSASGATLRLRVNDNVQIHKVEVQLNDCPAMSLNKLKRDYYVDARAPDIAASAVDSEFTDCTSGVPPPRTSFAAFSSADENSNEAPPKTSNKFGGKPKEANVIMIGQAAASVFDVDELKLKEGLTRESIGNATLLQLFYLCGMVREIPLSYELIDVPPNVDLSWRMFVSLISRDYGELTAKAIQRNDAERRAATDPRQTATSLPGSTTDAAVSSVDPMITSSTAFPLSSLPPSCSIGDLLGVTRRKRKLANTGGKPVALAPDGANGYLSQVRPAAVPLSSPAIAVDGPTVNVTREVHSEIVEAENEQFLRQLRAIQQPTRRRAQRQVKVVPNRSSTAGRTSQLFVPSMTRSATYAPSISMTGETIGISPCTSTTNMLQATDTTITPFSATNTVTSPRKDSTNGSYFVEGNQPLIVDESQLSSPIYTQRQPYASSSGLGGEPIVAYLSTDTGQLIGVDPNTTYVAVNLAAPNSALFQQQYSNLTECTSDTVTGGGGQTIIVHPTDFSHMAAGTSTPRTTYMSILDTSPPSSSTNPLRPMPSSTIHAAFRSPTRAAGRDSQRAGGVRQTLQSGGLLRSTRDAGRSSSRAIGGDHLPMADESTSTVSIGADLSIDFPMFAEFASNGTNSNMAASGASNSAIARAGPPNANSAAQPTSFVLLDASPSSKTLPEDVRHAYELMLKENSVDYCRNFAQLTRKMDSIQTDGQNIMLPSSTSESSKSLAANGQIAALTNKRANNKGKNSSKYGRAVAPRKN